MNDLWFRLRHRFERSTTRRQFLGSGPAGADKISLVLYFDYEREFGNPLAKETAEDGFRAIVNILSRHSIKATWCCVGLLADHYPQSLQELTSLGHELASHTYRHIDVTTVGRSELIQDIFECRKRFGKDFGIDVLGLHPPRDRWSGRLVGIMKKIGYRYLIARENNAKFWHVHNISLPFTCDMLCIPSIADDWGFMEEKFDSDTMLRFWLDRIAMLRPGNVAAIGFHPWVLGADHTRLKCFEELIEKLAANDLIATVPARAILEWYEQ